MSSRKAGYLVAATLVIVVIFFAIYLPTRSANACHEYRLGCGSWTLGAQGPCDKGADNR